jgi:hypothetical protein
MMEVGKAREKTRWEWPRVETVLGVDARVLTEEAGEVVSKTRLDIPLGSSLRRISNARTAGKRVRMDGSSAGERARVWNM